MKKTLAAMAIVLAAIVASDTFGYPFYRADNAAEAISVKASPAALSLTAGAGGGAITETNPLKVNGLPPGTLTSAQLQSAGIRSTAVAFTDIINTQQPTGTEPFALMSHTVSDPDLVTFNHGSPWGTGSTAQITAKGKAGSGSVTLNIRGWTCRHTVTNLYTAPSNPAFQAGTDPNTQSTPGCIGSVRVREITNISHTIPVHVAYGAAPAQHTITAVNLNYNSPRNSHPESVLPGGAIAEFTGSIVDNHSGQIPLFARLAGGALADSSGDAGESDRPYVAANFYSRAFEYSLSGTGDSAAVADMLEVETQFARVGNAGDWQPMANISTKGGVKLPAGTHTLTLTGRDNAPGGNTATVPVTIEVSEYRFDANDTGEGRNVTEDAPLIAYTIPAANLSEGALWNDRHSTSERRLDEIFNRVDDDEELRLQSITIADESVASVLVHEDKNTTRERFNIVAGERPGNTTVRVAIKGYVCSDGESPPAYSAPTTPNSGDAAPPTGCASGSSMLIRDAAVVVPVWVDWADPTPDIAINGINFAPGIFDFFAPSGPIVSFDGTVQSNHTGVLPLFAKIADGSNANDSGQYVAVPDTPWIAGTGVNYQGRLFTFKLTGAQADDADQTARNDEFTRLLRVRTQFAGGVLLGVISAAPRSAGEALPVGTFGLLLTGSDDAPNGKAATMPLRVTVTGANRAPAVSPDLARETRGAGDDAMQVPVIELPTISEDRAAEEDADADDVKVLHDFTGYFSDPDNQALSYSLRGAPAGVFRLVQGAKLMQVGDIEYDDIDADDDDNVHTAGVDANDDGDFADDGDTKPVLQYVFSVVASDGSAEGLIEVTLPIAEGAVISVDTGVEFDEPENNAANLLVGRVIIQQGDEPATIGFKIVENAENRISMSCSRTDGR